MTRNLASRRRATSIYDPFLSSAPTLLVRLRTAAVNAVCGLAKPCGYCLPASSTLCFAKRCMEVLPPGLVQALEPVLEQIASLTTKIKHYDRLVKKLTETEYVETQAMSSDHEEKTLRCDGGACIWLHEEESSRATELSLQSHASLQFCCIASGSRSNHTFRSTPKQLEVWIVFNCRNPASR
jgi:hypothetical protein